MSISIWQLMILLLAIVVTVYMFGSVVKKAGFSRWWSLLLIVPVVNLMMVWVFAFMKWPAEKQFTEQ